MEWQPIETMPKQLQGLVWVYIHGSVEQRLADPDHWLYWSRQRGGPTANGCPTHWMPFTVPPPPTPTEAQ